MLKAMLFTKEFNFLIQETGGCSTLPEIASQAQLTNSEI
jgi:hypothetical protein